MIYKIVSYLKFLIKGKTKYSLHSPFVHEFIERALDDKEIYYSFLAMNFLRIKLKNNQTVLSVEDKGAGFRKKIKHNRSVKQIAKTAISSKYKAQVLFKIINLYQPNRILELGTSLGLTTCYLSNANRRSSVITIEGSKSIYESALKTFKTMGLSKINAINGEFKEVLKTQLCNEKFDFVFFDGNHTEEATLMYYNHCKTRANENSIFVFDDIYWSKSMTIAWERIIQDTAISLSIDLFSFGIVFFLKDRAKQNIKIIHSINLH